jgi:hypothetical protein
MYVVYILHPITARLRLSPYINGRDTHLPPVYLSETPVWFNCWVCLTEKLYCNNACNVRGTVTHPSSLTHKGTTVVHCTVRCDLEIMLCECDCKVMLLECRLTLNQSLDLSANIVL